SATMEMKESEKGRLRQTKPKETYHEKEHHQRCRDAVFPVHIGSRDQPGANFQQSVQELLWCGRRRDFGRAVQRWRNKSSADRGHLAAHRDDAACGGTTAV